MNIIPLGGLALMITVSIAVVMIISVCKQQAPRRKASVLTGLATGVGFSILATALDPSGLGQDLMLIPIIIGFSIVVAVGIAEGLTRRHAATGIRSADLIPRELRRYLPRTWWLPFLLYILTFATLIFTTIRASADDMGRAGRAYAYSCGGDHFGRRGPFPGFFYALPLAIGLCLIVLALAVAMELLVRRPRQSGLDVSSDERLRRQSAAALVFASTFATSAALAGVTFFAALAMLTSCPSAREPLGYFLATECVCSCLISIWSLARLLTSAPHHPGDFHDFHQH